MPGSGAGSGAGSDPEPPPGAGEGDGSGATSVIWSPGRDVFVFDSSTATGSVGAEPWASASSILRCSSSNMDEYSLCAPCSLVEASDTVCSA